MREDSNTAGGSGQSVYYKLPFKVDRGPTCWQLVRLARNAQCLHQVIM